MEYFHSIITGVVSLGKCAGYIIMLYVSVRIGMVLPYQILRDNRRLFENSPMLKVIAIICVIISILCLLISFIYDMEYKATGVPGLRGIGFISVVQMLLFVFLIIVTKGKEISK